MKLNRLKNRLQDHEINLNFNFTYLKETVAQIEAQKNKTEALIKKILSEINSRVSKAILKGEKKIELSVEKTPA